MESTPHHVAIILDGNRRWAQKKGKSPIEGHRAATAVVKKTIHRLRKKGVHTITLWIFSTENWKRNKIQVNGLMNLFSEFINTYYKDALKEKTRIIHIGRKDRLPSKLREKIIKLEQDTSKYKDNNLNIALDYGGRDEIVRALKKIQNSKPKIQNLEEENFNDFLDTADQPYPYPDMVVRTGGEYRISGFMIWQAAYAEYFFVKKYLPDLTEDDIDTLLKEYSERKRRYGK